MPETQSNRRFTSKTRVRQHCQIGKFFSTSHHQSTRIYLSSPLHRFKWSHRAHGSGWHSGSCQCHIAVPILPGHQWTQCETMHYKIEQIDLGGRDSINLSHLFTLHPSRTRLPLHEKRDETTVNWCWQLFTLVGSSIICTDLELR